MSVFSWEFFVPTHENSYAVLEYLEKFVTLGVLPATLTLFFKERRKERLAAQYLVYDSLDEHYGEFLRQMMDKPLLPVYPPNAPLSLDNKSLEDQIRTKAAFELLISIFERAFLMYRSEELSNRDHQWSGWAACMHSWCRRPGWESFFDAVNGEQFDIDFVSYIKKIKGIEPNKDGKGTSLPELQTNFRKKLLIRRQYDRITNAIMNYGMFLLPLVLVVLIAIYATAPKKEAEQNAKESGKTSVAEPARK